ncbi:metal-dependent hydrolase [Streptomyces himalayensis]|uniref:Metal-dependent hydrolase n=1 Tax=Streptomyces himalayensis subsp. himalayensis TaxID=2756131 RepID=A0A7W0DRX7_9ACTN|nr:metal-dependent hydrolase [Streptomyces himalayensis]MBA2950155.1 metal-dependent hydrolase [Streptomyces himalayensis subsp. himalayensis]
MLKKSARIPTPPTPREDEHDHLVLQPRDVEFDWARLPLHWIPGEPLASHVINVLHMLLPEGERWFVRTFKQALPMITDERLREDVIGFVGQEAVHAEAHQGVLDHFLSKGLDPTPYVRHMEWLFHRVLGDRECLTPSQQREHVIERVALIAAIEHFTAFLGDWVLNADGLDRAGVDPVMLDLLRWHGAEEVEHRSVAYDLLTHLDPGYARRIRAMAVAGPVLYWLWIRGARFLMAADPELSGAVKAGWRAYMAASRRGLLPELGKTACSAVRYLRRGYHPSQEGSTRQAIAYLGSSPAARAAAH